MPAYTVISVCLGCQATFWRITAWTDHLFDEAYFFYRFDTEPLQAATVGRGRVVDLILPANV